MKTSHLIVDGMLSGTGVRDGEEGGYLNPSQLEISADLVSRMSEWLLRYENAHYFQFEDRSEVQKLDIEGLSIAQALKDELPKMTVSYFSNANMKEIPFE
jgi:hypothetical protein